MHKLVHMFRKSKEEDFTLVKSEYGEYVKIEKNISDSHKLKLFLETKGIKHVVLSEKLTNLQFLKEISSHLTKLICVHNVTCDFKILEELTELKHLYLEEFNSKSQVINMKYLQNLEYLNVKWSKKMIGLNHLENLKELELRGVSIENLESTYLPKNLRQLTFIDANLISLECISNLMYLEEMTLYNLKRIRGIEAISNCHQLRKLTIEKCKLMSGISGLESLHHLEELNLINCGEINSLLPISNSKSLQFLRILGSTKIIDVKVDYLQSINTVIAHGLKKYLRQR